MIVFWFTGYLGFKFGRKDHMLALVHNVPNARCCDQFVSIWIERFMNFNVLFAMQDIGQVDLHAGCVAEAKSFEGGNNSERRNCLNGL